jgi:hypothetical protein
MSTATPLDPGTGYREEDLLRDVMNESAPRDKSYFGQLMVKAEPVVLHKGAKNDHVPFDPSVHRPDQLRLVDGNEMVAWPGARSGRVPFDPSVHREDQKVTEIYLALATFERPDGQPGFLVERRMIVASAEWRKITRPSLVRFGMLDLNKLKDKFGHLKMKGTGRKYINRMTGDEIEATAPELVGLYNTEAECKAAAEQFFAQRRSNQDDDLDDGLGAPMPVPTAISGSSAPPAIEADKTAARSFLLPLARQAKGDRSEMERLISRNEFVNRFFSIDSQEVQEALASVSAA